MKEPEESARRRLIRKLSVTLKVVTFIYALKTLLYAIIHPLIALLFLDFKITWYYRIKKKCLYKYNGGNYSRQCLVYQLHCTFVYYFENLHSVTDRRRRKVPYVVF